MTLSEHVKELRRRLAGAAASIVVGSVAGWYISVDVLAAIREPIAEAAKQQDRLAALNYDSITSAFDLRLEAAVTIGVIISSPIWLYQLTAFVLPALTKREARGVAWVASAGAPLFLAGCGVGWLLVPRIVSLMLSFAAPSSSAYVQANDYFGFILRLVIATGMAFLAPAFLVLLNRLGALSARTITRAWRGMLVIVVSFAAVVTPSADLISMFLLAIPLAGMYVAAAAIATVHDSRSAKRRNALVQLEPQE